MDCRIKEDSGATWLQITGRIDGMTAPEIQNHIERLILGGVRWLIIDLEKVNYISSAGLRVLLAAQKQLRKIEGTIVLYRPSQNVLDVLKITGFNDLFPFADSTKEVDRFLETQQQPESLSVTDFDGRTVRFIEHDVAPIPLLLIGSQEKTAEAAFSEADVVSVRARDIPFGIGLSAMGEHYTDFKDFFGESIIVQSSLFSYPAVKQPAVDFMICADQSTETRYHFLHGFGFGSGHRCDLSIDAADDPLSLTRLVDGLFTILPSNLLGLVFLSQSKGLWGMHLKKVPTVDHRPPNNKGIFDSENFPDWIDFPIEPEHFNHILIGVGLAARNQDQAPDPVRALLPASENFHVHGCVFSQGPLANSLHQFDDELHRILNTSDAIRVQHLLGKSRLGNTLVRIFALED